MLLWKQAFSLQFKGHYFLPYAIGFYIDGIVWFYVTFNAISNETIWFIYNGMIDYDKYQSKRGHELITGTVSKYPSLIKNYLFIRINSLPKAKSKEQVS